MEGNSYTGMMDFDKCVVVMCGWLINCLLVILDNLSHQQSRITNKV